MDLSRDGTAIVTFNLDKSVRLWNATTGQVVLTFRGHSDQVWGLAFSPDGRHIVSSDPRGTVKLWDVATGREIFDLRGRAIGAGCVAFSHDGRLIEWHQQCVGRSRHNSLGFANVG